MFGLIEEVVYKSFVRLYYLRELSL